MIYQPTDYSTFIPCTWGGGTDEEIVAMVEAHYERKIDLQDFWSVGDSRVITLTTGEECEFVLMNAGGLILTSPINNRTECAFVVGTKECLQSLRPIDSSHLSGQSWHNTTLRDWLNATFIYQIPDSLRSIFLQHKVVTTTTNTGPDLTTDDDYFALAAETQIFGKTYYGRYETSLYQFSWYEQEVNRNKTKRGSTTSQAWWTRSPVNNNTSNFSCVMTGGDAPNSYAATSSYGISPYGVI